MQIRFDAQMLFLLREFSGLSREDRREVLDYVKHLKRKREIYIWVNNMRDLLVKRNVLKRLKHYYEN